jgi:hypothetical protein
MQQFLVTAAVSVVTETVEGSLVMTGASAVTDTVIGDDWRISDD